MTPGQVQTERPRSDRPGAPAADAKGMSPERRAEAQAKLDDLDDLLDEIDDLIEEVGVDVAKNFEQRGGE